MDTFPHNDERAVGRCDVAGASRAASGSRFFRAVKALCVWAANLHRRRRFVRELKKNAALKAALAAELSNAPLGHCSMTMLKKLRRARKFGVAHYGSRAISSGTIERELERRRIMQELTRSDA